MSFERGELKQKGKRLCKGGVGRGGGGKKELKGDEDERAQTIKGRNEEGRRRMGNRIRRMEDEVEKKITGKGRKERLACMGREKLKVEREDEYESVWRIKSER